LRRGFQFIFFSFLAAHVLAADSPTSLWEKRAEREADWRHQGLSLVPYRANYFFPFTYNTTPHPTPTNEAQYKEAKYQFSFKVLLVDQLFDPGIHLFFGYTQLSLWQVYDRKKSAPFRDINHEPEIILSLDSNRTIHDIVLRQTEFGLSHQSNGTGPPESRSWNRFYANFLFDHKNLALELKPWIRLPDFGDDDNRDIEHYLGYGEVTVSYFRRNHIWSLMFRNNLQFRHNRGAIEVNYSFPLTRTLTGLLQWFSGYGESLIDYNNRNNRFSLGLALSHF
jgi:phospholipase A1